MNTVEPQEIPNLFFARHSNDNIRGTTIGCLPRLKKTKRKGVNIINKILLTANFIKHKTAHNSSPKKGSKFLW